MDPAPSNKHKIITFILLVALVFLSQKKFDEALAPVVDVEKVIPITEEVPVAYAEPVIEPTTLHQPIPENVKGIYLTGWSAGNKKTIERIIQLVEQTELNTVVIDIKDASGKLSYQPQDEELKKTGVGTNRIKNLPELIELLHEKDIYVIGRLSVFQDPFYASQHPEDTYIDTRTGTVWRDFKGISWLRVDSQNVWEYTAQIAHDAYKQGFDEINVDYVRYPSDGNLAAIDTSHQIKSKPETLRDFFIFLDQELRGNGIPLSADVFGLTLSIHDGLGIGQKIEVIAPYVDYLCPMIYPSHYYPGSFGFNIPAAMPYEVIKKALTDGTKKLDSIGEPPSKLRPWLQDFDLVGVSYTADMIQAQIRATEESGVTSWLFWDPRNIYTKGGFKNAEPTLEFTKTIEEDSELSS